MQRRHGRHGDARAVVRSQAAVGEATTPLLELLHWRGELSGWALLGAAGGETRVLAVAGRPRVAVGDRCDSLPCQPQTTAAATLVHDARAHDGLGSAWRALGLRSAVIAPVSIHGDVLGSVIGLAHDRSVDHLSAYSAPAVGVAQSIGRLWQAHISTLLERDRADALETLAFTDVLTGLPNRRAWDMGLRREDARVERHGHNVVVVVIDLDELKQTNDRAGHAAGDALIRNAAEALQSVARAGDVLARIGGDEFGIVAVHCQEGDAEPIRQRVINALADAGIAASVGAALGGSSDGSLEGAWEHADALMYMAKRDQRRSRAAAVS